MSLALTFAEAERLLHQGAFEQAESLLRIMRQSAPQWLPAKRLQALISLLKGDPDATLAEFSRLDLESDAENRIWHDVANFYAGQPTIKVTVAIFYGQLAVERLRRSPYMDYPLEVHIETLTSCNAKCTFCPYPKLERIGNRMSDELIDKIIGDLGSIPNELPFGLAPFKVNDPLIDKRIFDICAHINRRLPNAQLRLFTNGSALTDKIIERIAQIEHLQHLWISLNEYQPEPYHSLMSIPLERTLKGLDQLHKAVQNGLPHPVIISRVRDLTANDDAFTRFVRQRYPRFAISLLPYANWAGQIESKEVLPVPPTGCCRWFELSIMSTGEIALCCMDGEGKHIIGDVSTESALAIYNKPLYRKLRQDTRIRQDAEFPCNQCEM